MVFSTERKRCYFHYLLPLLKIYIINTDRPYSVQFLMIMHETKPSCYCVSLSCCDHSCLAPKTPWTSAHLSLLCPWNSPAQEILGTVLPFPTPRIFHQVRYPTLASSCIVARQFVTLSRPHKAHKPSFLCRVRSHCSGLSLTELSGGQFTCGPLFQLPFPFSSHQSLNTSGELVSQFLFCCLRISQGILLYPKMATTFSLL